MLHRPPSFFDTEHILGKIQQLNDFLPKLNALINWEVFRTTLQKVPKKIAQQRTTLPRRAQTLRRHSNVQNPYPEKTLQPCVALVLVVRDFGLACVIWCTICVVL